jgi:hypothetical protein
MLAVPEETVPETTRDEERTNAGEKEATDRRLAATRRSMIVINCFREAKVLRFMANNPSTSV